MIIFDIETKPMPLARLKEVLPAFDPTSIGRDPGKFDQSAVKIGNLKDKSKIDAKIQAANDKHLADVETHGKKMTDGEANYWTDHHDKAALAAETGAVCAIGYRNDAGKVVIETDLKVNEHDMLMRFWLKFEACRTSGRSMIGFNSNRFDVPFLVRRSWYAGVTVPASVFTPSGYVSDVFVDLMTKWQCGDRRSYVSLDRACKSCGIQGKPDDCTGALFHQLLHNKETQKAAIEYLKNDLEMTFQLAEKMQVI